ncbi:hypothetical protein [Sphingomonas sp. RB1R13]|uniref:hypothetical protein n=1 Tax=Sphingomonas sp. RB1R13 TaxID=3096159 RepID=UPI002FC89A92
MNMVEVILIIVVLAVVGKMMNQRMLERRSARDDRFLDVTPDRGDRDDSADNRRLRDEVQQLKSRIQVLERIAVEKENSLAREIDQLRDR